MVPWVDKREQKLHGLRRVQNDLGTKALFVALFVFGLLLLAAIAAPPARANLAGPASGSLNQVAEVGESTTATTTNDAATVTDDAGTVTDDAGTVTDDGTSSGEGTSPDGSGAVGGEESETAPVRRVLTEVVPPVAHKAAGVAAKVPSVSNDTIPIAMEGLEVDVVLEDSPPELPVSGVAPVLTLVEDIQPLPAIIGEGRPFDADVVMVVPTLVDTVPVFPTLVPAAIVSPGSFEASTGPAMSTISRAEPVRASQTVTDRSLQMDGLYSKELVAELALFHLTYLTGDSVAGGSAAARPEPETPPLAAYVPTAGAVPVVGGVGGSASAGSSHSGSSSFADAFDFFATMAALLALCVLGLIRDRSRSGRSIFPSHGGRPG